MFRRISIRTIILLIIAIILLIVFYIINTAPDYGVPYVTADPEPLKIEDTADLNSQEADHHIDDQASDSDPTSASVVVPSSLLQDRSEVIRALVQSGSLLVEHEPAIGGAQYVRLKLVVDNEILENDREAVIRAEELLQNLSAEIEQMNGDRSPNPVFDRVGEALRAQSWLAYTAIDVAERMFVGRRYEAVLSVTREAEALGVLTNETPQPTVRELEVVATSELMARASSAELDVELLSVEWQTITTGSPAVWRWRITPKEPGTSYFVVSLHQKVMVDGEVRIVGVQRYPQLISVSVGWVSIARSFLASIWSWGWAIIAAVAALSGAISFRTQLSAAWRTTERRLRRSSRIASGDPSAISKEKPGATSGAATTSASTSGSEEVKAP